MRVHWVNSKLFARSSRVFVVTELVISETQCNVNKHNMLC